MIDNLLTCSTRRNSDEEDDDGYVPESLASFVHAFDVAFEEAKQNFFETIATPRQSQHNRMDESDCQNTPLPNPANHFTTSAAKRELDIRTEPRAMERPSPYSTSSFAPSDTEECSGHEVVLSIGAFNHTTISPIAAVASPQSVASPARQKLFESPEAHTSSDRTKSIRETSRQSEEKEAPETKGSSSPSRPSARKRRTQFIKARKAIASKRVVAPVVAVKDEPSPGVLSVAKKTSNLSPLLQSRLMKGATARLAKKDERHDEEEGYDEDSISADTKGTSGAGQPMTSNNAETMPTNPVETFRRMPSDEGMASTTNDVETMPTNQIEVLHRTPFDKEVTSTTNDVETMPTIQVESLQRTPFDKEMTSMNGDFLMSDTGDVAMAQVLVLQNTPSQNVTVSSMCDSVTNDASDVAKTKSPALQRTPSDKVTPNATGDSRPSDIVTSEVPALQRTTSDKTMASTVGDSLLRAVATTQSPAMKRTPSDKGMTIAMRDSLSKGLSATQSPVLKRTPPNKVLTIAMGNSLSKGVAATQSPVLKRTSSNKVTASTMDVSLTSYSDSARTQSPAVKRAPTSKVTRPVQTKSREKENHNSTESNKIKKPTLDEKIAAARERARLKNQEKESLLAERIALKSKCSTSGSVRSVDNRHLQRPIPKTAPVSSNTRMVKPRVTIPQSPNFATNAKLGVRKPTPSVSIQTSLAQSTDVLRRVLRSQESTDMHVRRVGLTIPKTPKFATDRRLKQRLINPETPGKMTLAQSNDMHRRGLRTMPAPISKRSNGLTIPKSPKFQMTTKRALPQSAAEKETEIMYYYKSHPFKAAPIMKEIPQKRPTTRMPRPSANVAPLVLRVGNGVPKAVRQSLLAKTQHDEDTQYKFHARPMPDFFRHNTSIPKAASRKPQTKPIPFHLLPCPNSAEKAPAKSEEMTETSFRARPLPKTTYEYRPPPKTPPRVVGDSKAPDLATAKRSLKHDAIIQLSRARAEALSVEKEAMQKIKQREQHEEALKKAELYSHRSVPNHESIKPFELQSTKRHETYVKQLEEKKRQEEEERLKQMKFHARSFHPSPAPTPIQSPRTPTQPEPFNISGMDSVESGKAAARKRLLQIDDDRKSRDQTSPFKARPIPSSTYTSPSSLTSRSSPQVSFRACRTPTRASPSTAEMAQSSYHHDSPSDISDSRDDEIEIEFTEGHTRDSDIGHFFSNLMNT